MVEILSYNPGSYVYENLTYVFYFDFFNDSNNKKTIYKIKIKWRLNILNI
jgi:hypothetical protein